MGETDCKFPANPGAPVTAAVVRDTMKWTFCVCGVFVREQSVVYHLLQAVPVVELAVKTKTLVPALPSDLWFISNFKRT